MYPPTLPQWHILSHSRIPERPAFDLKWLRMASHFGLRWRLAHAREPQPIMRSVGGNSNPSILPSADVPLLSGATRLEVWFVCHNIAGQGYHYGKPFVGVPQSYIDFTSMMTSMWASYSHDLDLDPGNLYQSVHCDIYSNSRPVDFFLIRC